jgi:hypothetical protein
MSARIFRQNSDCGGLNWHQPHHNLYLHFIYDSDFFYLWQVEGLPRVAGREHAVEPITFADKQSMAVFTYSFSMVCFYENI